MKATTRNKVVLIVAVAVIFLAIGIGVGLFISYEIIGSIDQFYFHEHKVQ